MTDIRDFNYITDAGSTEYPNSTGKGTAQNCCMGDLFGSLRGGLGLSLKR